MHILMTYFPNSCALTAEEIKESDKISLKYVDWNEVEWFLLGCFFRSMGRNVKSATPVS